MPEGIMPGELAEKVIVLTGGGSGIGAECAAAYVREGARVVLFDRDSAAAESVSSKLGAQCVAVTADVADGAAVESAIATVANRFGRIDAVHNNAGIASPSLPLHETRECDWDLLQAVNVKSVYWTTRFAYPYLASAKGSILNTASMVGLIGQENHAAYVASKGAIISLTKAMAADYAAIPIRVNAICPAAIWTATLEHWCEEQPDASGIRASLDHIHRLGPCPHGDVVADVAVFLLSHRARFMTGTIVPVSGGAELGYRH